MPKASDRQIGTLSKLPFSSLIGGPLVAAIEAQGMAAASSIDFITQVCVKRNDKMENGKIIDGTEAIGLNEIEFKYSVIEGTEVVYHSIKVPLIVIVPIPFIRIESVNIGFTVKMTEANIMSNTTEKANSSKFGFSVSVRGIGPGVSAKASFYGSLSSSYKNKSHSENRYNNEMNLDINVQAVQDDMPGGLKTVLGILSDNIASKKKEPTDAQTAHRDANPNLYD